MIAEILYVLAGHQSSVFPKDHTVHPAFAPLLHPGEQQCLEALGLIAFRYRRIKEFCASYAQSRSRYICALSSTLSRILKDEYEAMIVDTEAKVLRRDASFVASGSFVPLSSIRATFTEWDAPFAALVSLVEEVESRAEWHPGALIDMLLNRSRTGVYRIADILSRLSTAVQRAWRTQLIAFLVHGTVSTQEPLASNDYVLLDGSMPSCISMPSRDSIAYVGRAIATVKAAKWQKQLPRNLADEHTSLLEKVMPENRHAFDLVIAQVRTNVSEWLWLNVLTRKDVEEAVESLGNYFLLRNGEFSLALIREIERLKLDRLTLRSGSSSIIREQDMNLAILRASLGTLAQQDPSLSKLRFTMPEGPLRPLLPSFNSEAIIQVPSPSLAGAFGTVDPSLFNSNLLGSPLTLNYTVSWPLDLFLYPADLSSYASLFSYLSALRRMQMRIHICWSSLSNAQRARRRWTGLGEGGTAEDLKMRQDLLRCGWGVVRDMSWFFDTIIGYVMTDVVDVEFRRLKGLLGSPDTSDSGKLGALPSTISLASLPTSTSLGTTSGPNSLPLDFTTLRLIHTSYLDRLLTGCLLTNPLLTTVLASLFEVCERFVAQVERWGGDVLPDLLSEGSLESDEEVGALVKERSKTVFEINEVLHSLLDSFYEQLSLSTSPQQPTNSGDVSLTGISNVSMGNYTTFNMSKVLKNAADGGAAGVRRHIERLLMRLDFNGRFSDPKWRKEKASERVLAEGGIV